MAPSAEDRQNGREAPELVHQVGRDDVAGVKDHIGTSELGVDLVRQPAAATGAPVGVGKDHGAHVRVLPGAGEPSTQGALRACRK